MITLFTVTFFLGRFGTMGVFWAKEKGFGRGVSLEGKRDACGSLSPEDDGINKVKKIGKQE